MVVLISSGQIITSPTTAVLNQDGRGPTQSLIREQTRLPHADRKARPDVYIWIMNTLTLRRDVIQWRREILLTASVEALQLNTFCRFLWRHTNDCHLKHNGILAACSGIVCDNKLKLRECFTKTNRTKIARFVRRRNIAGVAVFFGPAAVWGWRSPSSPPPMDPPLTSSPNFTSILAKNEHFPRDLEL